MRVTVYRVSIPAMSTIGYGFGVSEGGQRVSFVGDHRPMRDLGEAVAAAESAEDLPVVDDLDPWQIVNVIPRRANA